MISVKVQVLTQSLKRTESTLNEAKKEIDGLVVWALERVKKKTPVDAGATRAAWRVVRHRTVGNAWRWSIRNPTKVSLWLEEGTPPHEIPRPGESLSGQAMRFEIGGEVIFAKRVQHPGTKPLGMMATTVPEIERRANKMVKRITVLINKK